ncbi:MAG: heparinase II/III family protein [Bacteroidales bacterium]|nr:heparinase II/III family protein [Bacteroidales bacterium]
MKQFRIATMALLLALSCGLSLAQSFDMKGKNHPRLLLGSGEEAKIKKNLQVSAELHVVDRKIMEFADEAVAEDPQPYKKQGKRLLYVCQRYLRNFYSLGYAYRMTHERKYVDAAIKHLKSACTFQDWNSSHFLDVGEMTMAVSIAYDWFYDQLPTDVRNLAEQAIEHKGLEEALTGKNKGWYKSGNNWNQVCNAGMVFGAIAIGDKIPAKAQQIIDNYYQSIALPLKQYEPDGAYPEGFLYWEYGTGFNVMLNCALENIGLTPRGNEGAFLKSAQFYFHMAAPSGMAYNYSDGGSQHQLSMPLDVSMFYFAAKQGDTSLLWNEMQHIRPSLAEKDISTKNMFCRLLPAILIYTKNLDMASVPVPTQKTWSGDGTTPVYVTRSAWGDPNAAFLGVKGGSASTSHAHMDMGSFVYEVNGVRWAIDPGNDEYFVIENAGIDLWNGAQDSERWKLLRYGSKCHNMLTLNGADIKVSGKAEITRRIDEPNRRGAVLDLTSGYDNVKSVARTICLVNESGLQIDDRLLATADTPLKWTMMTEKATSAQIVGKDKILLTNQGRKVELTVSASVPFTLDSWTVKATTPYEDLDARAVGFNAQAEAGREVTFTVRLSPVK